MNMSELLKAGAIRLGLDAASATEVIETLGNALRERGCVNDGFVAATLAREASMPTGLPLGGEINAAIPHVDIEYVSQPALGLATLKAPVVFQNMVDPDEAVPVQLVIMLALDQPKSQVEMLQQVAQVLQRPDTITALMHAQTPDDVFAVLSTLDTPV